MESRLILPSTEPEVLPRVLRLPYAPSFASIPQSPTIPFPFPLKSPFHPFNPFSPNPFTPYPAHMRENTPSLASIAINTIPEPPHPRFTCTRSHVLLSHERASIDAKLHGKGAVSAKATSLPKASLFCQRGSGEGMTGVRFPRSNPGFRKWGKASKPTADGLGDTNRKRSQEQDPG